MFQSTHLRGARLFFLPRTISPVMFQSTRCMRGATNFACYLAVYHAFQSTRRMRGATIFVSSGCRASTVSIHTPHARRDAKGSMEGFFCHIFVGITCHKYVFSHRFVPQPSFDTVFLLYFITVFSVHSTFAHIKSYSNKTYSSFSQRFICQTTRKRFPVYRHSSSPARRGCSLPEGSVARRTLYLSLSLSIPSSA